MAFKPNYAINPTPELDLRSNRAVQPARVIAALGIMSISLRDLRFNYEASFRMLVNDFLVFLSFVDPVDDNLSTYSHRAFELLLRACTEFESLAKDALVRSGDTTQPNRMNMSHYRNLEVHMGLEHTEVGLLMWRPGPVFVAPFAGWTNSQQPVAWYRDYNAVKHNRASEFPCASLKNVRLAIAAVFTMIVRTNMPDLTGIPQLSRSEPGHHENTITREPYSNFTLRVPRP